MNLAERMAKGETEACEKMEKYRRTALAAFEELNLIHDSYLLSTTEKIYASITYASATFYFEPDISPEESAELLREFVRVTGIRLTKSFSEHSGQFIAKGEVKFEGDNYYINFVGFTPPTCQIIREEVTVPGRVETKWRSVCGPAEGEGPVEPEPEANVPSADAATTA